MPDTTDIVVSALPRNYTPNSPISFLRFDINSQKTDVLPYTGLNVIDYRHVSELSFSPNGQYLLYRGLKFALVEFATGRLLREFDVIYSQTWLDNQTLLVQGIYDGRDLEIFRFDAVSGASTTLLRGEEAAGVLLVP